MFGQCTYASLHLLPVIVLGGSNEVYSVLVVRKQGCTLSFPKYLGNFGWV